MDGTVHPSSGSHKLEISKPNDSSVLCSMDFSQLLDDEIFTFFVGPSRRVFRIHISALKRISEPLAHMMSNGSMKESIEKEAVLDDIDPDAFAQLAKFAYLGICGITDVVSANPASAVPDSSSAQRPYTVDNLGYQCHLCKAPVPLTKPQKSDAPWCYPFCSISCRAESEQGGSYGTQLAVTCIVRDCRTRTNGLKNWLCSNHKIYEHVYGSPKQPPKLENNLLSSNALGSRQYSCKSLTHEQLSSLINSHEPTATIKPQSLVEHARLYCLADRYLVPELPAICLHQLQRDLLAFVLTDKSVEDLADLLLFVYTHTSDDGDILDDSCNSLRVLVMCYIAMNSAILMKHRSFREILCAGGGHTADFMALTFRGMDSA